MDGFTQFVSQFVLFHFKTRTSSVFLFNAFSPIWSRVAIYYSTTDYKLNLLCNWYFLGPIIFTPIFNPFILNHFAISQILSNLTTMGGLWILYFSGNSFQLAFMGFTFIGIGQALYFHVPLRILLYYFRFIKTVVRTKRKNKNYFCWSILIKHRTVFWISIFHLSIYRGCIFIQIIFQTDDVEFKKKYE